LVHERRVNRFFNAENIANVLTFASFIAMMAVGMTAVIVMNGIDLSIGSIYGLSAVVGAVALSGLSGAAGSQAATGPFVSLGVGGWVAGLVGGGGSGAGRGCERGGLGAGGVGGAGLWGGRGTAIGAVLGAIVIQLINNGFDLLGPRFGVDQNYRQIVIGLAIVL